MSKVTGVESLEHVGEQEKECEETRDAVVTHEDEDELTIDVDVYENSGLIDKFTCVPPRDLGDISNYCHDGVKKITIILWD